MKEFFNALDAPLTNQRWSWGAVRRDGAVFLRVWQDEVQKQDGAYFVKITYKRESEEQRDSAGNRERLRHVERICKGATVFLIMCVAKDVTAVPRKVKQFDAENVRRGGRLRNIAGEWWIELVHESQSGNFPNGPIKLVNREHPKTPNRESPSLTVAMSSFMTLMRILQFVPVSLTGALSFARHRRPGVRHKCPSVLYLRIPNIIRHAYRGF